MTSVTWQVVHSKRMYFIHDITRNDHSGTTEYRESLTGHDTVEFTCKSNEILMGICRSNDS